MCVQAAIRAISSLIKELNVYMREEAEPPMFLLQSAARYITDLFEVFGLVNPNPTIGYSTGDTEGGVSKEEALAPILDAVTKFRETGEGPTTPLPCRLGPGPMRACECRCVSARRWECVHVCVCVRVGNGLFLRGVPGARECVCVCVPPVVSSPRVREGGGHPCRAGGVRRPA